MPLAPGDRFGAYEITARLGAGGMGEVYRAHDTRLGRDVAIKVLPDAFARDAERLARFEREARLISHLNHPNICALYHIGDAPDPRSPLSHPDSIQFLVLELVEGRRRASCSTLMHRHSTFSLATCCSSGRARC